MTDGADDRPGRVLSGRYELIETLGQGGMAVVWRGVSRGSDGFSRPIAIKRIEASCRGFDEVIEMFVEEARIGGRLQHPNIVQVYDFGVDEGGERYLITELVRGLHLREWVNALRDDGELPPWELVAAVGVEVLRALDAAHSHRDGKGHDAPILHRDVTPTNILLDVSGVVKLADFGLARAGDRARMTRPNVVKGKLAYLAPELLTGQPPSVQTDLFSLGVVLWEALTGKRLFDAETDLDVVRKVQRTLVPLLSRERPALPLGLSELVHRALDREPGQRFHSARAMLEALTDILRVLPRSVDALVLGASVQRAAALKQRSAALAAQNLA